MQIGNLIIRDVHARSVDIVLFRAQDIKSILWIPGGMRNCSFVLHNCRAPQWVSGYLRSFYSVTSADNSSRLLEVEGRVRRHKNKTLFMNMSELVLMKIA